jgi:glycosyltransferase involved in cell wall biosynthesis
MEMKQYGWQWQLTDRAESLLSRIPDWIICNSQAGMRHAVKMGYPQEKMSVVPNGIDRERFFPNRELGMRLREQWGVKANQKLIGMAARIDPMKDYPNFLHAASLLLQERKDISFVCVGAGPNPYIREYNELARRLNLGSHLAWAGEQTDMLSIYNALDVFVLSSAYGEGFSNAIGEAMACGVPCVATDVGDAALLIGSLGEIAPPRDPQALKQAISTMLNRLEENGTSLRSEGMQRIAEQFSLDKLVSRTVDTLQEVFTVGSLNERNVE